MPTIRAHPVSIRCHIRLIAVVVHLCQYLPILLLLLRLLLLLLNLVLGVGCENVYRGRFLRGELGTHISKFSLLVRYHLSVAFQGTLEVYVFLA